MSNVPPRDAGLASGIVNVSMQVASAIGVAVLGTIATDCTKTLISAGRSSLGALTGGYQLGFTVAAAAAGAALLVALTLLRAPARRAPERVTAPGAPESA